MPVQLLPLQHMPLLRVPRLVSPAIWAWDGHSSIPTGTCCTAASEGPSAAQRCVPAAHPSHPAATMVWGFTSEPSLKLPLPMNIFMEESNLTPRSWCNLLPKAGSSCVLRPPHSWLYLHEIFIERKLYNLSRQSDPSLTVLVRTCLTYQQSHLPEPQQVTHRMDSSIYWTVTERGLVCLGNQNSGSFHFWPRGPGADFSL